MLGAHVYSARRGARRKNGVLSALARTQGRLFPLGEETAQCRAQRKRDRARAARQRRASGIRYDEYGQILRHNASRSGKKREDKDRRHLMLRCA